LNPGFFGSRFTVHGYLKSSFYNTIIPTLNLELRFSDGRFKGEGGSKELRAESGELFACAISTSKD
jgi:hypothetical protein